MRATAGGESLRGGFKAPIRTPSARRTRAQPPARRRGLAPPASSPGPPRIRLTGVRRRGGPRCWPGGRGPGLPSRLCKTGRGRRGGERDPALAERTGWKAFRAFRVGAGGRGPGGCEKLMLELLRVSKQHWHYHRNARDKSFASGDTHISTSL